MDRLRLVVAAALVASGLVAGVAPATASTHLTVTFLAVGNGDAAVYRGPCGETGVVDAGAGAAPAVLRALDAAGSRDAAWIAVSHYDADHVGDVVDLAAAGVARGAAVYDRGGGRDAKDSATYRAYHDWVTAAGVRRPVDIGSRFALCSGAEEVTFTVVAAGTDGTTADGVAVTEENDRGVCLHVTYRRFDLATCGDVNGTDEGPRADVETVVADAFGDVEVAKVNHHGSASSSNAAYVSTLSAEAAVVTTGANGYGHPDPQVVARWRSHGDVYQTGRADGGVEDGDVVVTTTGTATFTVAASGSGRSATYPLDSAPAARAATSRLAGEDRFDTAARVSAAFFPAGVGTVYVATGLNFPDALAAGPVAGMGGSPVLLVTADAIPTPTRAELSRLRPDRIVVLGGPGTVSEAVVAELGTLAPGGAERIAGADRFATAAALSARSFRPGVPAVFVATGLDYPDALSGGPAAAVSGAPILLVARDGVPPATAAELSRLAPQRVVVLGGPATVSDAVAARLGDLTGGPVTRLAGADRFATSAAIAAAAFPGATPQALLATGLDFPDALAGTPAAVSVASPLLLVRPDCAPDAVVDQVSRLAPATVVVLGGPASVGDTAAGLGRCPAPPPPAPAPPPPPPPPVEVRCDPAYPSVCLPPPPPDLDCGDIPHRRFAVLPPDPHRLDGDRDGMGCESG